MASQAIGSLYVALGLDSAAFTQGVKRVQTATGKLQAGFEKVGNAATALGKRMSVVSGAMATVGAAAVALVKNTADAAKEISIQSKLANASTKEFQRWAAGSKTVGIQQDKLADILKDVNDRVGDFMETGGGPMADFFENVAPKVGVTAEQFKNLSGPQALQLYVDTLQKAGLNQQQMTFYLEAMASDATALIPLLLNGGKAMDAYGDAAEKSGAVMSDTAIRGSLAFQEKLGTLRQAVDGVRNRLAEALLPIVNRFMDVLIDKVVPAMDKAVSKIESLIQWFGDLPQPVQEAAAAIAATLGAGGPILLALGVLSKAIAAFIASTGPIGLFVLAITGLAAAWIQWGDDIKAAVGAAIDWISIKFQALLDFLQSIVDKAKEVKTAIVDALTVDVKNPLNAITGGTKGPISSGAYTGGATGPILPGTTSTDMINGVAVGTGAARAQGAADASAYEEGWRDGMEIHSPSQVMARIGQWIMQGLGIGIDDGASGVKASMTAVTDAVAGQGENMADSMGNFASAAQSAFQSVITGAASVKDALKQLAAQWLSTMASNAANSAWSSLMGAFGIGANANGTSHWRGGLTRINERGEEIVQLPSGSKVFPAGLSKRMAGDAGGQQAVHVTVGVDPDTGNLTAFVDERAGMAAQSMGQAVSASIPGRIQQYQRNPRLR